MLAKVTILQNPEIHADKVNVAEEMSEGLIQCTSYNTTFTFTDDDILFGSKPHNQSLFVTSYIRE